MIGFVLGMRSKLFGILGGRLSSMAITAHKLRNYLTCTPFNSDHPANFQIILGQRMGHQLWKMQLTARSKTHQTWQHPRTRERVGKLELEEKTDLGVWGDEGVEGLMIETTGI